VKKNVMVDEKIDYRKGRYSLKWIKS